MKAMFRIAALFSVYSAIGWGGETAVGLLLADDPVTEVVVDVQPVVDVEPTIEARVVVDVLPTVVTRVQVRHGAECTYEVNREMTIPIANVNGLAIDAGAGELHVEGQRDLDDIVVVGLVCASDEAYLEELWLSAERGNDGQVELVTHYPEDRRRRRRRRHPHANDVARIDLTVLVPYGVDVEIDDSSGDMVVSGTGNLKIDDSSGSIRVFDIAGDIYIDDSSGDLEVRGVAGDAEIDDSSASLEVHEVAGSVRVRDGSGSIEITEIGENVIIESDGSGSIDVRTVGGDFIVEDDGNGSIRHSGVEGRVDVPQRRRRGG